eukprot:g8123.t1
MASQLWEWTQANLRVYNPRANFEDDVFLILTRVVLLLLLRFCFAGAYHRTLRKVPCALDFLTRSHTKHKDGMSRAKYFENIWYTLWHTSASVWAFYLFFFASADASPSAGLSGKNEAAQVDAAAPPTRLHDGSDNAWRRDLYAGDFHVLFVPWREHLMSAATQDYYLWQSAFWTSSLIFLFAEKKRKDFVMMLIHHLATVSLVFFSYTWNYWRIGLLVLLLHDSVDIWLYAAKAFRDPDTFPKWVSELLFGVFALLFLVNRLLIYPVVCVYTAVRTGWAAFADPLFAALNLRLFGGSKPFPVDAEMRAAGAGFYSMPTLLAVLLVLHVIWYGIILRIVAKALKSSLHETGDVRSDSDCSPPSSPQPSRAVSREERGGKKGNVVLGNNNGLEGLPEDDGLEGFELVPQEAVPGASGAATTTHHSGGSNNPRRGVREDPSAGNASRSAIGSGAAGVRQRMVGGQGGSKSPGSIEGGGGSKVGAGGAAKKK